LIIGKNNGLNGWEQQNLHITIKCTRVLKRYLLKQIMGKILEWGFFKNSGAKTKNPIAFFGLNYTVSILIQKYLE